MDATLFIASLFLVGVVMGCVLAMRRLEFSIVDRFVVAALPCAVVLSGLGYVWYATEYLWQDDLSVEWVNARIAPIVAFFEGYDLYAGMNEGVLLGTHYGPVSYFFFAPASIFGSPTHIMLAASFLVIPILLGAAWFLLSRHGSTFNAPSHAILGGLCFFSFWMLAHPATRYMSLNVHADAPALIFATVAFGLAIGRSHLSDRDMVLIALCATLSVWSKQLAVPIFPALLLYSWFSFGQSQTIRLTFIMFVVGSLISAAFFILFGPEKVWLNMFALSASQPIPDFWGRLDIWQYFLDYQGFWLVFALAAGWQLFRYETGAGSWAQFLKGNPATLMAITIVLIYPLSVTARLKAGGDWNSHYFLFFMNIFCSLAVVEILSSGRQEKLLNYLKISAVVGPLISAQAFLPFAMQNIGKDIYQNRVQVAYEFEKLNPGKAYFPWHPLSTLMANGEAFHYSYAIKDRALANIPITRKHRRRYQPVEAEYLLLPFHYGAPGQAVNIKRYDSRRLEQIDAPGIILPDGWRPEQWYIYKKKPRR